MANSLILTLIPAPGEGMPTDLAQLEEVMQRLPLRAPRERPVPRRKPVAVSYLQGSAALPLTATSEMLLALAAKAAPTIGTALLAWLHGRLGRRVHVKIGDVEVEASTPKEVAKLLEQAHKLEQSNEPKRIRKR